MKKKLISMLLLAAMLTTLVLPAAALSLTGTVQKQSVWTLYEGSEGSTVTRERVDGNTPSGVQFVEFENKLTLEGTPETAGSFSFTVFVAEQNESFINEENPDGILRTSVTVSLTIDTPTVESARFVGGGTVGKEMNLPINVGAKGSIFDVKLEGTLPDGLTLSSDETTVYIKGTPKKAGEFKFVIVCFDAELNGTRRQPVTLTIAEPEKPGKPVITKQPTGETVEEAGRAVFIARADYAEKLEWYLVSANGDTKLLCKELADRFVGLRVSGYDQEKLILENIPLELNGWSAKCKFYGTEEAIWSDGAKLTVTKTELKKPEITVQPHGTQLQEGQTTILRVTAISPDNNTLSYQWYWNDTDTNTGGKAISGATQDTYIPEYREGTSYYYCVIYNKSATEISVPARTECAAVTYTAKPAPETEAPATAPTETTLPETQPETVEPTISFTEPSAPQRDQGRDLTLVIIVGVVVCVCVIAVCATILIIRYFPRKDERDEDDEDNGEEMDFDEVP